MGTDAPLTLFDIEPYLVIDKRIDTGEAENIRDRWEFGRLMLAARKDKDGNPAKRLPNGRLEELVQATGKSQSELSKRLAFAEKYPSEAELCNALQSFTSWYDIAQNLGDNSGNGGDAHVSNNSGDNEWYTPAELIEAAVNVMGGIDLDPASNAWANDIIGATTFYDAQLDGLTQQWFGRVWMNPPYAQPLIDKFCTRISREYADSNIDAACVLVNNATETGWFQTVAAEASAVCFPRGRIKFWHPDKASATPLQGQAILYLGQDTTSFAREFQPFGFIMAVH